MVAATDLRKGYNTTSSFMKKDVFFAKLLANLLDNSFHLFGLRFGVSAIIDLIPGLGDILDVLMSAYIIWLAIQYDLPNNKIAQMIWNSLFSFLIGLIPIIGDAAYIFYRPNLRNIRILKQYTDNIIEGKIIE